MKCNYSNIYSTQMLINVYLSGHLTIIEPTSRVWLAVCVCGNRLIERLMSLSPNSQVMFASAFSWISDFFVFLAFIVFKLRPLCFEYMNMHAMNMWLTDASGRWLWGTDFAPTASTNLGGVTAGQVRHNISNVGGVTTGQVWHNSSSK